MEVENNPLVSVAVITYNSAAYVLETLESIKSQTYVNIELVISDDCSDDNTVELCQCWLKQNGDRFNGVQIINSAINTGQSGNYNRAFDACNGEWIKEVDGDDRLLPNCIFNFVEYTHSHSTAKYIFGRVAYWDGSKTVRDSNVGLFNYDFFTLDTQRQLEYLINIGNCIPSLGSFYNRKYILELGFRNDERIPFLEDLPKWVALLKKNVHFDFLDIDVAEYRINSGISTKPRVGLLYYKSTLLYEIYYRWPEWMKVDPNNAADRIANTQLEIYRQLLDAENEVKKMRSAKPYRVGRFILHPLKSLLYYFKR